MEDKKTKQRIGVYICHCGGNISDYVDVEQLRDLVSEENGVVVSKNVMFACADSNQKEMVNDIRDQKLDGIVVASCSPKLHLHTFRNVAERGGLNPYNYVQVNVREQCSWAHSDHPDQASYKAAGLIRAGIKRVSHSEALETIQIKAHKSVVVIGAGVAGLKASLNLARMGNKVFLVEKEATVGGQLRDKGALFPTSQSGTEMIKTLLDEVKKTTSINLFTNASIDKVTGSIGNFRVDVKIHGEKEEVLPFPAGAILVTTGYETGRPAEAEYGYGLDPRIITLHDFNQLVLADGKEFNYLGKKIRTVAFIYCVGMRQTKGENKYCSRVCCTAAIHSSLEMNKKFPAVKAMHLYRDIRTYGKQEMLYEQSSANGDLYFMFQEKEPPQVITGGEKVQIKIKDSLTRKKELEIEADLLVLVTGMVPRTENAEISGKLKIPVGNDKFFNEIHPKLRPVETVINGIFLGGSCQGPKNISESVQSSLSAAAKINAIIKKESIDLEPIVASINPETCSWCEKCREVCEYEAIFQVETNGKLVAAVNESVCKGCGVCAPVCPADAIEIAQYTDLEIEGMIDGFSGEVVLAGKVKEGETSHAEEGGMKDFPELWRRIMQALNENALTIPQIAKTLLEKTELVTWHVMTMYKYYLLETAGMDEDEEYYLYKLKNKGL